MASFHPIDPDKNPNKKQKVNNVDTSTSPHTVTQEISPLSLSIGTDDNDTYTYTPPGTSEPITIYESETYPLSLDETVEDYLGPKDYWKDKIKLNRKNICNPFANKPTIKEINDYIKSISPDIKFEITKITYDETLVEEDGQCQYFIHTNNGLLFTHNINTNKTNPMYITEETQEINTMNSGINKFFEKISNENKTKDAEIINDILNLYFNKDMTYSGSHIQSIINEQNLLAQIPEDSFKGRGGSKPSMNQLKFFLNKKERLPQRYAPKHLTKKDQKKQKKNLSKSRKLYKKGIYFKRPKVKSFKSKKSRHINNVEKIYGVKNMSIPELSKKTKCTPASLNKIIEKGQGAYYSSGSRPNQTAHSWGVARLASSLTGGNAAVVDYHVLEEGCKPDSKALKLAKKQCKKMGRNCGNNKTKKI